MKKRNMITSIAAGTILSLSMAASAMAGTAAAPAADAAVEASANESASAAPAAAIEAAGKTDAESKETVIYGKVSKVEENKIEIELASEEKTEGADEKTTEDTDAAGKEESLKLVSEDKAETLNLEENTVYYKEAADEDSSEIDENKTLESVAADVLAGKDDDAEKQETIKKEDLKEGDIVKVVLDKDNKVKEITVLSDAEIIENSDKEEAK